MVQQDALKAFYNAPYTLVLSLSSRFSLAILIIAQGRSHLFRSLVLILSLSLFHSLSLFPLTLFFPPFPFLLFQQHIFHWCMSTASSRGDDVARQTHSRSHWSVLYATQWVKWLVSLHVFRNYELIIREQPVHSRMCGVGERGKVPSVP